MSQTRPKDYFFKNCHRTIHLTSGDTRLLSVGPWVTNSRLGNSWKLECRTPRGRTSSWHAEVQVPWHLQLKGQNIWSSGNLLPNLLNLLPNCFIEICLAVQSKTWVTPFPSTPSTRSLLLAIQWPIKGRAHPSNEWILQRPVWSIFGSILNFPKG